MSITMQDLREIAIYPYRPEQRAFPPDELYRQKLRVERAAACDRTADEAAKKGETDKERIMRENAFFFMYGVARQYFLRFDDEQRLWYCLVAARLALAAGKPIYAMECCEVGLLQVDAEEEAETLRELLGRAQEEIARSAVAGEDVKAAKA